MRSLLAVLFVVVLIPNSYVVPAEAAPPRENLGAQASSYQISYAGRALEIAQLKLDRYEKVEYPLRLRRVESAIKLATAEVESHRRRVVEYEQFTKATYSSPLFHWLELSRLALAEAELRLKDLQEERLLVERFHRDECRLYELDVEAAQAELRRLESR